VKNYRLVYGCNRGIIKILLKGINVLNFPFSLVACVYRSITFERPEIILQISAAHELLLQIEYPHILLQKQLLSRSKPDSVKASRNYSYYIEIRLGKPFF